MMSMMVQIDALPAGRMTAGRRGARSTRIAMRHEVCGCCARLPLPANRQKRSDQMEKLRRYFEAFRSATD